MGMQKLNSKSDLATWTRLHDVSVFENIQFRLSTRIGSIVNSKKSTLESGFKKHGYGEQIRWILDSCNRIWNPQ